MDTGRFDELARAFAAGGSRRTLLSLSLGGAVGLSWLDPARGKARSCSLGCDVCQQCVKLKCHKRRKHRYCGKRVCASLDNGASCPGGTCQDGGCVPAGGPPPPSEQQPGGATCFGGMVKCGGKCVDLQRDRGHCGTCDRNCQANADCQNSQCVCNLGTTVCGDDCADLLTDPNHCGECGFACPAGQSCEHGTCSCDPFDNSCPMEVDGQCGCSATVATPFVAACTDRNSACDLSAPCNSNEDCPPRSVCLQGCADSGNRNRCSKPCVAI